MQVNTIGILTSGGDAPGMNAAIRSIVRTAKYYNLRAVGVHKGYKGLLHGDIREFGARDVSDILGRGGTILQTARCPEFKEIEVVKHAVDMAKYHNIDSLVVIGGDGSFRGAKDLCEQGLPTIGIPGTIDNDINCSDYSLGFDTAINTAMEAIDKIRDTATSHERCNIIEVMGRNSGAIAIQVAIACGAEAVFIPEMAEAERPDIIKVITDGIKRNKQHFIVVVAEGVGHSHQLGEFIQTQTGIVTKVNTLGYMQRGGSPTVMDRVSAAQMGERAVELLINGISNRIVGMKNNRVYDIDIFEGLSQQKDPRRDLIDLAIKLSV